MKRAIKGGNEKINKRGKELNKAGYTAPDALGTRLREGVTNGRMDGLTDGLTDGWTDERTDSRTHPLMEKRRRGAFKKD